MLKINIASSITPATDPPAIAPVFEVGLDVGLVVWLEDGAALVEPIEVETNECVGEGTSDKLAKSLADVALGAVDSIMSRVFDDGGFEEAPGNGVEEVSCEGVEDVLEGGTGEVPNDVAEVTLEVNLESCA